MKRQILNIAIAVLTLATLGATLGNAQTYPPAPPAGESRAVGVYYAPNYAFGYGSIPAGYVESGIAATGSGTLTMRIGYVSLPDGRKIVPYSTSAPIFVGSGTNQEKVTPSAVSGCYPVDVSGFSCQITATFANLHGRGEAVYSASFGLQEAINDAVGGGGGTVTVDQWWGGGNGSPLAGTNTILNAALVYSSVSIIDYRTGIPRPWNATPTGAALAVPTTLTAQTACDATHQFCSDANVAGSASYAGGTLFGCAAYVDILGNEGPCSLTASFTDVSTKAIDMASPAASTGAVGWIPYLSLDAGTYAQAYKITPTAAICALSTLTPIPSCAITNTTYGSVGSTFGANALFNGGAQITGYPVNTSQHFTKLASTAMTAASLTPVSNSSVSYSYAPGNRIGSCQISSANVVNYAASGSSATTIPNAVATWTIPANCFNYIGAEFRVSGKFTFTDGGDTSTKVLVAWDASGTNTTTVPTTLCSMVDTATGTAAAYNGTWYCSVKVATTGATGTALVDGYANLKLAAGATTLVRDTTDVATAPSASINLTSDARIVVYFIGTGATNNPGAQGLAAKFEVIN